jgi:hypothetical protein
MEIVGFEEEGDEEQGGAGTDGAEVPSFGQWVAGGGGVRGVEEKEKEEEKKDAQTTRQMSFKSKTAKTLPNFLGTWGDDLFVVFDRLQSFYPAFSRTRSRPYKASYNGIPRGFIQTPRESLKSGMTAARGQAVEAASISKANKNICDDEVEELRSHIAELVVARSLQQEESLELRKQVCWQSASCYSTSSCLLHACDCF